ncbi:hypothetical protein [Burkholderia sp. PU8-34]
MTDTFELIAISLPPDIAPEALPATVKSMFVRPGSGKHPYDTRRYG